MNTPNLKPKYGNEYARLVATMQNPDEIECVGKAIRNRQYLHEMAPALFERARSLLTTASPLPIQAEGDYLQQNGVRYDLRDWLTLKEYATRYGLTSTNVVSNWIRRGIVPADCLVEVRTLNGLKLVRNRLYQHEANTVKEQCKNNVNTVKEQ